MGNKRGSEWADGEWEMERKVHDTTTEDPADRCSRWQRAREVGFVLFFSWSSAAHIFLPHSPEVWWSAAGCSAVATGIKTESNLLKILHNNFYHQHTVPACEPGPSQGFFLLKETLFLPLLLVVGQGLGLCKTPKDIFDGNRCCICNNNEINEKSSMHVHCDTIPTLPLIVFKSFTYLLWAGVFKYDVFLCRIYNNAGIYNIR